MYLLIKKGLITIQPSASNIKNYGNDDEQQCLKLTKEKKNIRKSEIPIRIKSSSPITSPRQLIKEDESISSQKSVDVCSSLPPKSASDVAKPRTILRASRKRKLGYKKSFSRSKSDSQLKVDSANNSTSLDKLKSKPPPLEIKLVHSCENFTSLSSPLLSACSSMYDSSNSPMSATIGSFDFSQVYFTLD